MFNIKLVQTKTDFLVAILGQGDDNTYFISLRITYVILNNKCIYFIAENRQKGRFARFSLYISNSGKIQGSTLCYKDGTILPPLNFTITCAEYGRYLIFYNERVGGVTYPTGYEFDNVYTELCEVIVKSIFNF